MIDAEPIVVKRVIDDTAEYPKFMPYVAETKTLSNDGTTRIGYQRLSPPIVGDRDYTVRVHCESKPCPTGGMIYCNRWEAANDLGPAEKKGVTRVKITEGSWLLEPAPGGKTRATYTIYSDSGRRHPGDVPEQCEQDRDSEALRCGAEAGDAGEVPGGEVVSNQWTVISFSPRGVLCTDYSLLTDY